MSEKRKSYDKGFKLSAVKMINESGISLRDVSKDLGINESSLHKWKKDYMSDQQNTFPGKGRMKPEEEELRRVKKELARVTMERDILKKQLDTLQRDRSKIYVYKRA